MPAARGYQANFTAGEWSPRLRGRSDLAKYANACRELTNIIVQKHGGWYYRPGTQHVAEIKDSSATGTRLIEFQFSVEQTYILEFGNLYVRFYRDGAQMEFSGSPTEKVLPYTDAQLAEVKFTQSADVLYLVHPEYEPRTLSRGSGDDQDPATWTVATLDPQDGPYLDVNTTTTTMTLSGGSPDSVSAGSTGVTVTASAVTGINDDTGFKSTDVGRLMRIHDPTLTTGGWLEITAFTSTTIVTATIKGDIPSVGPTAFWRLGAWSDTTGWPWSTTFHQQRLWFGAIDTQPQTLFASEVGAFNSFTPTDIVDFTLVLSTNSLNFTIDADQVNAIRWLASDARGLLAMTAGGVFVNANRNPSEAITPTEPFAAVLQDSTGAHATTRIQRVPGAVLMVSKSGLRVHELLYNFEADRIIAPDITILAEHITLGGLTATAYQLEPDSILWAARDDGSLLGMTYERAEQVVGWHLHTLGGILDGEPKPIVQSLAVIREGTNDQLWMIVRRTVDGATVRYIEFMKPRFSDSDDLEDAWILDSALLLDTPLTITGATAANPVVITATSHGFANGDTVRIRDVKGMIEINDRTFTVANKTTNDFELEDEDGASHTAYVSGGAAYKEVTTVSGLGHLEGQTVGILVDGAVHAEKTVSSSAITLDSKGSRVLVGLKYKGRYESMPLIATLGAESRGAHHRIAGVNLWVDRSIGGRAGAKDREEETLDTIEYRDFGGDMDAPPPLRTEVIELASLTNASGQEVSVVIELDDPVPFNLLSMEVDIEANAL